MVFFRYISEAAMWRFLSEKSAAEVASNSSSGKPVLQS